MSDPGRPSRPRVALATRTTDDQRDSLEARLLVFTRLMFVSFLVLIGFLAAVYEIYPEIKPANNRYIVAMEVGSLVLMAAIWQGILARRRLSVAWLYRIDTVYAVGIGTAFGASGYLAPDLRPAAWTSLLFWAFATFTRSLLVPSSGRRTAVVSALSFVPLQLTAIGLVRITHEELPDYAFIGGAALIASVVVLLAASGSRIIYSLRQQVTEAMHLGEYTLERKIGSGGMGEVHRARHRLLARPTAIKLLRPERVGGADALDRFEREVQAMSQLTHPNTVAVFDYGRSAEGFVYYAMEYLGDGVNLEQLVARDGPQQPSRVAHILAQVCGALSEAHGKGMIHRDIKPPNIILCECGGMPDFAKVVDYGLVKEVATGSSSITAQVVLGTPAYLAPEVMTAPDLFGPAVDLYAVGAVGYFLLTGRPVFEGKTAVDTIVMHSTATPKPPSELVAGVPPALEALILRCLAKAPSDRPASAAALAAALRALPTGADGWDDASAAAWWAAHHARGAELEAATTQRTMTVTVDLEHHRR